MLSALAIIFAAIVANYIGWKQGVRDAIKWVEEAVTEID